MKIFRMSIAAAALLVVVGAPAQATTEPIVINSQNRSVHLLQHTIGCPTSQSQNADSYAPFKAELLAEFDCGVIIGADAVGQDSIVSGDGLSGSGHSTIAVEPAESTVWVKHTARPGPSHESFRSAESEAGTAVLHASDDCQAQWLPTFGGSEPDGAVRALAVYDDGNGPALYAGGSFSSAGGVPGTNRIARWDGKAWSPLGSGVTGAGDHRVTALAVFNDELIVGGRFEWAGGEVVHNIARWDGASWSPLAGGIPLWHSSSDAWVESLLVFDDGTGPALYVGGRFTTAGNVEANHIAKWDGENWSALGSGADHIVSALVVFDDGSGPALIAGGYFAEVGGVTAHRLAKWDGESWAPVAANAHAEVRALAVFDDGTGPALFSGGDGWGSGCYCDDLCCEFADCCSDKQAVCGGCMSVPALNVASCAGFCGGQAMVNIARLSESSWVPVGKGLDGWVHTLTVFDDGNGPALYAGGSFTSAAGVTANHIARWDGSAWSPVGSGVSSTVYALQAVDDTAGPALYVAGHFANSPAGDSRIAKWQGCLDDPVPPCPADVTGDSIVDIFDLLAILADWGECADPQDCPHDLDGDGVADIFDLLIVLANWGDCS